MIDLGIEGLSDATPLGTGGSSIVYRARYRNQDVAVKVLRGVSGHEIERRFEREVQALQRLKQHPGIIDILASGITAAHEPFLMMPLMVLGSLGEEIERNGPASLKNAVNDVLAVCDAIAFANRSGILHRDMKPANVLRADDGSVVVTDFGIARVTDSGISSSTVGAATPLYAAPELLEQNLASEPSEVYSVAALLYALLAGKPAFSGDENLWTTIRRVREEQPAFIPTVPPQVMSLILQGMEKTPQRRPQSVADFAMLLKTAVVSPASWRPPIPHPATVALNAVEASSDAHYSPSFGQPDPSPNTNAASQSPTIHSSGSTPVRENKYRRIFALLGAFVLLAALGVVLFAILSSEDPSGLSGEGPAAVATATEVPASSGAVSNGPTDRSAGGSDSVEQSNPSSDSQTSNTPTSNSETHTNADGSQQSTPSQHEFVSFRGDHFHTLIPEGWSLVEKDRDVGYGFRSDFYKPGAEMSIDTTPAELRSEQTIEQSAASIASQTRGASEVQTSVINGKTMYWFSFRNNKGLKSIDIFFEIQGNGYAVVASAEQDFNSLTEEAFLVAAHLENN